MTTLFNGGWMVGGGFKRRPYQRYSGGRMLSAWNVFVRGHAKGLGIHKMDMKALSRAYKTQTKYARGQTHGYSKNHGKPKKAKRSKKSKKAKKSKKGFYAQADAMYANADPALKRAIDAEVARDRAYFKSLGR